ncbi:ATP-binding protein, partial [Roseofilum sp. Guam]|uniref:ATP-binding protein n=1 Tax=Roseofilum sp. Guam TaxID=2821502 RepID=UPI001B2B6262
MPLGKTYKFFQGGEGEQKGLESDLSVSYQFLHDRVQQAAYSLIGVDEQRQTHLKIGRCLLDRTPLEVREEKLFAIASQLNAGTELLKTPSERDRLARLNLQAARKAKSATAYGAAANYCTVARQLLPSDSWQSNYRITREIFVESLEAEYLNTNFEAVDPLAAVILQQTCHLLDRIEVYEIKIRTCIGQGNQHTALEIGLEVLELLNISLLEDPPSGEIAIAKLMNAPEMSDPEQLAALHIMTGIITSAWAVSPVCFRRIVFTMVDLSLKGGNCASSAFGYAWYGALLCETLGEIDRGYEFGQLAVALLDRLKAKELHAKVLNIYATHIGFWRSHVRESRQFHLDGLQSGLATGDFEFASYNAAEYAQYLFLMGLPLDHVRKECQEKLAIIQHLKQDFHTEYLSPWLQAILNLLGESEDPTTLTGEIYQEGDHLKVSIAQEQLTLVFILSFLKSFLSYLFGDYKSAIENGKIARAHNAGVTGSLFIPTEMFYSSLASTTALNSMEVSQKEKERQEIEECVEKLKHWAKYAPHNYQHKCDLIEAELARQDNHFMVAMELYDRAITGAKANEYLQEEALANELAAQFYLDWGKEKIAQLYITNAYYCYARWGAKAKTNRLREKYPQLLIPILQQNSLQLNSDETITSTLMQAADSSGSTTDFMLDWMTAMKAAQSLSSEIHLDKLILALMKATMENAGADGSILLLNSEETWQVAGRYKLQNGQLHCLRTPEKQTLPTTVLNKVKHTQQTIIVNNFSGNTQFAADPYLLQEQPKSFLCTPILNQGKLIGILYLENHLAVGAFTSDRMELMNMLCSQAAISLENARLYQQSQDYAQKLEQSFADLQQAQLQLVQSEKMSALGNLVAGVAHEINNPVGFIAGNIDPARDYLKDLFGLLDLYQQEYPEPSEVIEEEIEAID